MDEMTQQRRNEALKQAEAHDLEHQTTRARAKAAATAREEARAESEAENETRVTDDTRASKTSEATTVLGESSAVPPSTTVKSSAAGVASTARSHTNPTFLHAKSRPTIKSEPTVYQVTKNDFENFTQEFRMQATLNRDQSQKRHQDSNSGHPREPKIAAITKFSEHADKVHTFLDALRTRFMLQPRTHADNITKVLTAVNHLEGSAEAWAKPIINGQRDDLLQDYTLFTTEFQKQFQDPNWRTTLTERMYRLRQTTSVLAYANDFENLVYDIERPKAVWREDFYRGLKEPIKDLLAQSDFDRADYDALKRKSIGIDQRLQNRERETKVFKKPIISNSPTYVATTSSSTTLVPATNRQTTPLSRIPRGPLPQAEKDCRQVVGLCLYCGEAGHIALLCTNKRGPTFAATGTEESGKESAQTE